VAGDRRRLRDDELLNLYFPPNIMGRECSMHGRDEKCILFWLEILNGKYHSEDLDVYVKIMLEGS
jgi:hypothetical protein